MLDADLFLVGYEADSKELIQHSNSCSMCKKMIINAGIDKMKDMEIYITKRSYNLQSEFRKYVWAKDKDGNYINEPEDHDNHGIDAVRYYVLGELLGKIQKPKDLTGIFTH